MNHCNGGRVSLAAGPHVRERKILGLESFSVQRCQISAESLETSSTINREHHQICGAQPYDFFFFPRDHHDHGLLHQTSHWLQIVSSQSFSREKGSFFSHNVKSVLAFARWPRWPVGVPEQTLLTRSQTGEMWKCLLAAGDSWLPFNPDEFSKAGEDAAAAAAGGGCWGETGVCEKWKR